MLDQFDFKDKRNKKRQKDLSKKSRGRKNSFNEEREKLKVYKNKKRTMREQIDDEGIRD